MVSCGCRGRPRTRRHPRPRPHPRRRGAVRDGGARRPRSRRDQGRAPGYGGRLPLRALAEGRRPLSRSRTRTAASARSPWTCGRPAGAGISCSAWSSAPTRWSRTSARAGWTREDSAQTCFRLATRDSWSRRSRASGDTGPRAGQPSYDIVAQATGGLLAMTGFADGPPVRGGGALGGLRRRALPGARPGDGAPRARPQRARPACSTSRTRTRSSPSPTPRRPSGRDRRRERAGREPAPVHGALRRLRGDRRRRRRSRRRATSSSARSATAIGRPDLAADERFRSHRGRATHRGEINGDRRGVGAERSCDEVLARARPGGRRSSVRAGRRARRARRRPAAPGARHDRATSAPDAGEVVFHGNPLRFAGAEPRACALAPDLGAEQRPPSTAELGLGEEDLAQLSKEGVI